MTRHCLQIVLLFCVGSVVNVAHAQRFATNAPYQRPAGASPSAAMLQDVGIDQHLNAALPLNATFRDEDNRTVRLGDYFGKRPVVLALVYYRCPMLCTQVLNGVLKVSHALPQDIGTDFDVVAVSFDPIEKPELAADKKRHYVRSYRREGAAKGWHFLTGDQKSIDELTKAVGFRYRFDEASQQYAHASGIVVVTPDGHLSRYFYGIDYSPKDLRLAIIESSQGRIGTLADRVLLLCYHYDPLTGKYGLAISRALWVGGAFTVMGLVIFLATMIRRERQRPKLFRETLREAPL